MASTKTMNIGSNPGIRPNWNNNHGPANHRREEPPSRLSEDGLDLSDIGQQTMSHLQERKPLLQLLQNTQPLQHHFNYIA
ncbi:MAG: hypothetical protein KIS61_25485 [Candidatus Eremiobacteraeota bacterium]|nr:hypothetical protein [Candidatus Eremiobacteraeota bacterium]